MSEVVPFIVEIGTEELPAKNLLSIANSFRLQLEVLLQEHNISHSPLEVIATMRRIGIYCAKMALETQALAVTIKGPSSAMAYQDNKATTALLSFAKKNNASLEELTVESSAKGSFVVYHKKIPPQLSINLLGNIINQALDKLPYPRKMRWQNYDFEFIRPIHYILALLDSSVIKGSMYGVNIGATGYGHLFFGHSFTINNAKDYFKVLQQNFVITDFNQRKALIEQQIASIATQENVSPIVDNALLNEVTGLTEWPQALLCEFSIEFLALPEEVLITAMQNHQRAFCLRQDNKLINKFIIITNNCGPNYNKIIAGNEQVMHARLKDAMFYYQEDNKIPSHQRINELKNIIFYAQLGTVYEKCARIEKQALALAPLLNIDSSQIKELAFLCKNDLKTLMVGEFPELQGIIGGYYAKNAGLAEYISEAISQHYQPISANDPIPSNTLAALISMLDKIDSITQFFSIKRLPTGDKDPFSLKRQGLNAMRIIIEKGWDIDLCLITTVEVINFCLERLKSWYEEQGISGLIFDSVISTKPTKPLQLQQKVLALDAIKNSPQLATIVQLHKRLKNILPPTIPSYFNQELLSESDNKLRQIIANLNACQDNYLQALLAVEADLAEYFNNVFIMVDDLELRASRLNLISQLFNLFNCYADFTKL